MKRRCALILFLFLLFGVQNVSSQTPSGDDLHELFDTILPGTSVVVIDGAVVTVEEAACGEPIWFMKPQFYARPQDSMDPFNQPEIHPLYANVLVADSSDPTLTFPARVSVDVVDPEWDEKNMVELMLHPPSLTETRGSARITVKRGEKYEDRQTFFFDLSGTALFDVRQNKMVIERRVAFEFSAKDKNGQEIHTQGAIYDVESPLYVMDEDLPQNKADFVALSGGAYAVTESPVVHVSRQQISDQMVYMVQIDTDAVLQSDSIGEVVSVSVTLTLGPAEDDETGGYEVVQSEISIQGEVLAGYAALTTPDRWVSLAATEGELSGSLSVVLGNGCGDFLIIGALFQNAPLMQVE